jgi:hypothetical protein
MGYWQAHPQMLRRYDFVTCPNDAVQAWKEDPTREDLGRRVCYGSMVLLVRDAVRHCRGRPPLLGQGRRRGGAVRRPGLPPQVRQLPSWGADPDFVGGNSGNPIKIEFSDPRQAGGGELFLAMLRKAQTDLRLKGERGEVEWLWGEDGPLYSYGAKSTKQLLRTFLNGGPQQMVFVYEHDVIAALLKEPERAKNYFLLRTSLEAVFTQYVFSLSRSE